MSRRSRAESSGTLRRSVNTRQEKARILIVTEGVVTEPHYFKRLASHYRATGVLVKSLDVVGLGRDPLGVVKEAARRSDGGRLVGKRDGYHSVWCVFDVDEHARLRDALSEARRMNFNIAVSNPCFELWLLLHFRECRKQVTRKALADLCRSHGLNGKHLPQGFPYAQVGSAIERSRSCDEVLPPNPGTRVWKLADLIRGSK